MVREEGGHLVGALEVELSRLEAQALRVFERRAGLDAEEQILLLVLLLRGVVVVVGGDERQVQLAGESDQLRRDRRIFLEPVVLDLDVVPIPEHLLVPGGVLLRRLVVVLEDRGRDLAAEAGRERDQLGRSSRPAGRGRCGACSSSRRATSGWSDRAGCGSRPRPGRAGSGAGNPGPARAFAVILPGATYVSMPMIGLTSLSWQAS